MKTTKKFSQSYRQGRIATIACLGFIIGATGGPAESKAGESLREVVTNGLSFLSREGPEFQNKKSCVTCHHGPISVWGERELATLGFVVDQPAADAFKTEMLDEFVGVSKSYDSKQWSHTLAAFFVLGQPEDWRPETQPKITAALVDAIKRNQQEDGSWKAAKQFTGQKRPEGEADQLQTLWNVNALSRLENYDDTLTAPRESALQWIRQATEPVSMDARAIQLLTEQRFGEPAQAQTLLGALLEDQNGDGSWGWNAGGPGDAWATGITLYALSFFGDKVPADRIESAQLFLAGTQTGDGSWLVPTKLKSKDHSPLVSSYFGTVWSVLGIARTLDRNQLTLAEQ